MAAIDVARLNNTNDVPKIELSKIDNLPYYIESTVEFNKFVLKFPLCFFDLIEDHIRIIKEEYNYEEVPIEDFYDSK